MFQMRGGGILSAINNEQCNLNFISYPPLEFMSALFSIVESEELINCSKDVGIPIDSKLSSLINDMKKNISTFLKRELEYFFKYEESYSNNLAYKLFWYFVWRYPKVKTVTEFIERIEGSDEELLIINLVEQVVYDTHEKPIEEICSWEKIKIDRNEILRIFKNIEIKDKEFKEKIIECIEEPFELKERFCFLLNQIYKRSYSNIEDDILTKLEAFREKYEKIYLKNPMKFTRDFLRTDYSNLKGNINIHISYFGYMKCIFSFDIDENSGYYLLGAYIDKYLEKEIEKENAALFFKALSDKKRIEMINLLAEKDRYVHELAEYFKMSSATILHHLGILHKLNILKYERVNHRVYYSLDKGKLKDISEKCIDSILKI